MEDCPRTWELLHTRHSHNFLLLDFQCLYQARLHRHLLNKPLSKDFLDQHFSLQVWALTSSPISPLSSLISMQSSLPTCLISSPNKHSSLVCRSLLLTLGPLPLPTTKTRTAVLCRAQPINRLFCLEGMDIYSHHITQPSTYSAAQLTTLGIPTTESSIS